MNPSSGNSIHNFGNELSLNGGEHVAARSAITKAAWLLDTPDAAHSVTIAGIPIHEFFLPEQVVEPLGSHWDNMNISVAQPPIDDAISQIPVCEITMRASDSPSRFARIAPHPSQPGQYLAVAGSRNNTSVTDRASTILDPSDVLDVVRSGFDVDRWYSLSMTEPVTATHGIVDTVLELRSEPTSTSEITSDKLTGAYVIGDSIVSTELTRVERTRRNYPPTHRYNLQTVTHTPYSDPSGEVVADVTRTLTYSTSNQDRSGVSNTPSKAYLAVVFEPTAHGPEAAAKPEQEVDYTRLYNLARAGTQITALQEVREALQSLASSYRSS